MKRFDAVVISTREITPGTSLLWLAAPLDGAAAKAGQFYMVRCGEQLDPLLRRPIAYHRLRFAQHGQGAACPLPGGIFPPDLDLQQLPSPFAALAMLVEKAGRGTNWLAARKPGDVVDVLGPLGSGFLVEPSSRNLLLVAGGMGIAPLVALCDQAVEKELSVTMIMGTATARQAYPAHLLPPQVELVLATEDGSAGTSGRATDLLSEYLGWADQVFACGPRGMYASMSSLLVRAMSRKSVQVSVEERMACGVGACLGCSIQTRHGTKTACKEGPVFELKELGL